MTHFRTSEFFSGQKQLRHLRRWWNTARMLNKRAVGGTWSVFDKLAWSHLQLAVALYLWMCPTKFNERVPSKRYPASSEKIASMLLWDTAICFSQADEIGTNIHRTPAEVDFESVKFSALFECAVSCWISNVTILSVVGCEMNVTDVTCQLKIACSVPLCNVLPSTLLSPSRSGLPVHAEYTHFNTNTIWEQVSDTFSHNFQTFWFYLVIVQTRCGNFM